MKRVFSLFLFWVVSSFLANGQEAPPLSNVKISNSKAILIGKTKPIKELIRVSSIDRAKRSEKKQKVTAAPLNFIGRGTSKAIDQNLVHQGVDPLWQKEIPPQRLAAIEPSVNMDGLFSTFGSPNDPTGDVGLDYYVQAINATDIAVYDKTDGSLVDQFAANTLWSSINESSAGDPIVLFDHAASRWIITEFTNPNGSANLLFAISDASDPLGSYSVYAFSPPNFPDYPKWAIWTNTYMVTTNESGPGSLHQYFFDRQAFLNGDAEVTMQRVEITGSTNTEAGFFVSTPVSWVGATTPANDNPIAVKINDSSWGEVANDAVELFTFNVDFTNGTTATKTTIETTPFDGYPCDAETGGFACLAQGGSTAGIDAIPEVIMNLPHYRNFGTHESIVLSFITDVDNGNNLSGIRWMELRKTTGDWALYQEGSFAPDDGLHRFMPSISLDKDGNIGLAYNTTSANDFVGIKYTGRYAEDPLGVMTIAEYNVVEGAGPISGDRFGDYAQMGIDPVDGRTFWYTSEYAAASRTNTRIVAFKLENPNDLAVESINNPATGSNLSSEETVTVSVKNLGENAASNFDLTFFLGGTQVETFNYSGVLASKDTLKHTFSTSVDLSALGDYEIAVNVDYTSDENLSNNSQTKTISHLLARDVSVEGVMEATSCVASSEVEYTITNGGGDDITSLDILVQLNGSLIETISWTGLLETGKSVTDTYLIEGLLEGSNTVTITASNPNGNSDQQQSDNSIDLSVDYNADLVQAVVTITTDNYPEEITWEIVDAANTILASGGPYQAAATTVEEYVCLTTDACYNFVIRDSAGDGICCGYGNGSYEITDGTGATLLSGDGQYGSSETKEFCLGCTLSVTVIASDAAFDEAGSIKIDATGGQGYQYSIDGGNTFGSQSFFGSLEAGTYEVVVTSNNGTCEFTEKVEISYILGINEEVEGLKIFPNPTGGVLRFSYSQPKLDGFLTIEVVDVQGRVIQNHRLSKYDGSYEGTISLYAYPKGLYFLRFRNIDGLKMVKILKE